MLKRDLSSWNLLSLGLALLSGPINAKCLYQEPEVLTRPPEAFPGNTGSRPTSSCQAPVNRPHCIKNLLDSYLDD